jgi:hypothetical protein
MKGAFGAVAEEGCLKTLIKTGHFGSTLLFYSRHRSLGTDELDGRQMNGIQRANENRKWLKGAPQDCRHHFGNSDPADQAADGNAVRILKPTRIDTIPNSAFEQPARNDRLSHSALGGWRSSARR